MCVLQHAKLSWKPLHAAAWPPSACLVGGPMGKREHKRPDSIKRASTASVQRGIPRVWRAGDDGDVTIDSLRWVCIP